MLPQFNFATFASQLFWLAVCFVALYRLMTRVAMPQIAAVLDERQRRIDDDLAKAEQLKAEAEAAVHAYEKALAEARLQAHTVLKQSQDDIARVVQGRNREVAERLAAEVKAGEQRIAAAREAALTQVKGIASEVAEAAVGRLAGIAIDSAKYQDAVTAALKERA